MSNLNFHPLTFFYKVGYGEFCTYLKIFFCPPGEERYFLRLRHGFSNTIFFSSPFIVKKMYYFVILSKYSLLNWLIVYSPQRMAQFHLHKIFWNEKQNLYLPIQMSIPLLFFGFYIRFIIKNGISQECNH